MNKSRLLGAACACTFLLSVSTAPIASVITFEEVGEVGPLEFISEISGFNFTQKIQGTLYSGMHVSPVGCHDTHLAVTPCNVVDMGASTQAAIDAGTYDTWVGIQGCDLFNFDGAYIANALGGIEILGYRFSDLA